MPISFTAQATGNGTTTLVITIVGAASGSLLVACSVCQGASARTVSSIATTNTVWTKLGGTTTSTIGEEIWIGVVSGGTSGTSVTYTFSGAVTHTAANVSTWAGALSTSSAATATGSSTSPATAAYSASTANALIIACVGYASTTSPSVQPGGSYSNLTFKAAASGVGVQANYIIPGVKGAQSATWTIPSVAWVCTIGAIQVSPQTSSLTAGMATMAGALSKIPALPLSASLATMAATVVKQTNKFFSAS